MYNVEVIFSGIAFIPYRKNVQLIQDLEGRTHKHTHGVVFLILAFLSFFLSLFKERVGV
jgi:hypothetical protein